jgi:hypothetical protein
MKRTARFVMLPWRKGLDVNTDEGIMQFIQKADFLVQADDIIYDPDGSKVKREGFNFFDSAAITNTPEIKGGKDYWANVSSVKTQRIVVGDGQATGKFWFQAPAGGAWTELTKDASATAPQNVKRIVFEVFNDDLIMAVTDSANSAPLKWNNQTGTAYLPLGGTPPSVKYVRVHQGRLWAAGDPARPDRLYFSGPGNHEEWNGEGDSGAIDIDPGDGDSTGITAIFPSFRGVLIVAKSSKLYRVTGTSPLDYKVEPISEGIGCNSHNSAIAVDMDDIYFQSERGFHSLVLTEKFGDFEGAFLSADIQKEFNSLDKLIQPYAQGVWIPRLNSVMWNVSEAGTRMDAIWLYDLRFKGWYRWSGTNPTALFAVEDKTSSVNQRRAYFGTNVGRLCVTQRGSWRDFTATAISQVVKTPFIYPDQDPATIKGFKKLGVWMKMPEGDVLTARVRLAGVTEEQELLFTSVSSGTPKLDIDFILGESILGADTTLRMTPYSLPIDGYASSAQITFEQAVIDEKCNIFGFWIEWEPAGDSQETKGY